MRKIRITKRHITRFFKRLGIAIIGLFLLFLLLNWIFPVPDKIEYSTIITDNKRRNHQCVPDQRPTMADENRIG
ncbi:MAG: hypothetical protein WDN26_01460 [Chitinophagaceae bacterium]